MMDDGLTKEFWDAKKHGKLLTLFKTDKFI